MIEEPQGSLPEPRRDKPPALTVMIQSWWTPVLAFLMLVIGLLAGYFGRPLLDKSPAIAGVLETTPTATVPSLQVAVPTNTVNPTVAAIKDEQQLMAYLVTNTKHFKGDPNAKVTMIEFSDYQ